MGKNKFLDFRNKRKIRRDNPTIFPVVLCDSREGREPLWG